MPTLLRLLAVSLLAGISLHAADESTVVAAVRAADDARLAAMIDGDRAQLDVLLSDQLRHAHSSGIVDTKASFIEAVAGGKADYQAITFSEREFTPVAPGVVLVSGRGRFQVASNGQNLDLPLSFLAVWREEKGQWRFLAWQSCRLPPPAGAR